MNISKLYEVMPIFAQNILCNIKGIQINKSRYNSSFDRLLEEFCERGEWANSKMCQYRDERIHLLIKHCYETVPYYHKTISELGLSPQDFLTLDDLVKLPIINKKTVIDNREDFISSKAVDYKTIHAHTSGSTGAGFQFITTEESIQAQWATFWRLYLKTGIKRNEKQGTFSGQMIVPTKQTKPPYWRYVSSQNRVYFSAYHEQEENLESYYNEIKRSEITWISGYPSLISLLADYMLRNNLENPGVKYVSTGAENLYGIQEKQIKKAFYGASFVQVYGQSENVAFFTQEANGQIWVDEDASATEFIENNDGSYDIVGTNLYNYAMPLIRYSTGDRAHYTVEKNGRRRVTQIDGRKEDYIVLPTGEKLGRLDYAFKDANNVSESQIYQKKDYSIVIRAVLKSVEGKKEVESARDWLVEATHGKVRITIDYVDGIQRTNTQKMRYVISEVECD